MNAKLYTGDVNSVTSIIVTGSFKAASESQIADPDKMVLLISNCIGSPNW